MNENALIVVRAFGTEKSAGCDIPAQYRSKSDNKLNKRLRAERKKKEKAGATKKSSLTDPSTPIDVEVTRIDKTAAAELYAALESPGYEKAAAGKLEALKRVLKEVIGPKAAFGGAAGTGLGAISGLVSPEDDHGRLVSALRRALAYGGAGAAAGAGAGVGSTLFPQNALGSIMGTSMGGGAGLKGMHSILGGGAVTPRHKRQYKFAAAQDAKKKEEEKDTEPGTLRLESDSSEKAKKAPEKKPEKVSENEIEYDKKAAALDVLARAIRSTKKHASFHGFRSFLKRSLATMGSSATPFDISKFGDSLREPKGHDREDMFGVLKRWSLGKE